MMHRKQVSTESYESDTNDRPLCLGSDNFDKWGMSPLRAPHSHQLLHSSLHRYRSRSDHEFPLPSGLMCPVIASPSPRPTRSDIRLWSGQFSLVSPLLCSVELTVITPTKNSVFSIFPASDIAACWGDWHHDDPMELGWIVNNASNLFLSKEINP